MPDHLERRRLAIAEALRAVMAEAHHDAARRPQPAVPTQPAHADPADGGHAEAASPLPDTAMGAVVTMLRARPTAADSADDPASELPSIRAALAAEIDWEDTDPIEPTGEDALPDDEARQADADSMPVGAHVEPEVEVSHPTDAEVQRQVEAESPGPAEADDPVDETPADETPVDETPADETQNDPTVEDVKMDDGGRGIPPIDTVGSMSSVASLALFGHA